MSHFALNSMKVANADMGLKNLKFKLNVFVWKIFSNADFFLAIGYGADYLEVARRMKRIGPLKTKSKRCLTEGPKDEEDQILLPKGHDMVQGKNSLPSVHKSIVEDMVGTIHGPKAKTCVA